MVVGTRSVSSTLTRPGHGEVPQPTAVLDLEDPLLRAYAQAWSEVMAEQQALADDPVRHARRARLREMQSRIEAVMTDLDATSLDWVSKQLPQVYAQGGVLGAQQAGGEFIWGQIHQEAVQELVQRTYEDLLSATTHVRDDTKKLVRTLVRDETLQKTIQGRTAVDAGARVTKILESKGISAVVYRDGSKHGLKEYGQTVVRTVSATAYNLGTLNAAHSLGVMYWECFDGPDCGWSAHYSPDLANGKIVTRDEALGYPISHPNCRRSFGARPDITTPEQALAAKGGQVLPEQNAAVRAADEARQARLDRRKVTKSNRGPASRVEARQKKLEQRKTEAWVPEPATGAPRGMGDPLPADEDQVWANYAAQSYELNDALRRGEIPEVVSTLDQVFRRSRTPDSMMTYRMIDDEALHKKLSKHKPGRNINLTDNAYMSTSLSKEAAMDFTREEFPVRLDIELAKGTPSFYVGDRYASRAIMMDQEELVLPRGAKLQVYETRKLTDGTVVAKARMEGFAPLTPPPGG